MKNYLKYWPLVAIIAALIIGFFVGRANQKEIVKTSIEYLPGKTIYDTIFLSRPYEVIKPVFYPSDKTVEKIILPSKKDTVWRNNNIYISEKVDTSKIIEEFATINKYKQVLFNNDSLGKFTLGTDVQYNKLKNVYYEYKPIYKEVTNYVQKKNTFTPFVGASYNTFNQVGAGAGVFIKNFGVEYKYLHDLNLKTSGHEAGIKIKF